jgi:hypothetical protein
MTTTLSEHGTRSAYKKGCRCELCRAANARYKRELQAAHHAQTRAEAEATGNMQSPALEHGKAATAEWYGCRCEPCVRALNDYKAKLMRRSRWRQFVEDNILDTREEKEDSANG